jgi:ABC-type multidrug transport system fused ATPase/permease subunit
MQSIINFIDSAQVYVILALIALVLILIVIIIMTYASLNKLENRYRKLMRGVNNKNLEDMVMSYLDRIDEVKNENEAMKQMYEQVNGELKTCVQKTSMIRYKAFDDVGSDLSFSIALLDGNNNGAILTSIYGRNESTTYAKPIDKGISRYDLSEEEKKVLEQAITLKNKK